MKKLCVLMIMFSLITGGSVWAMSHEEDEKGGEAQFLEASSDDPPLFSYIDENGNESISRQEYKEYYPKLDNEQYEDRFERLDRNQNDSIELDEWNEEEMN